MLVNDVADVPSSIAAPAESSNRIGVALAVEVVRAIEKERNFRLILGSIVRASLRSVGIKSLARLHETSTDPAGTLSARFQDCVSNLGLADG